MLEDFYIAIAVEHDNDGDEGTQEKCYIYVMRGWQ